MSRPPNASTKLMLYNQSNTWGGDEEERNCVKTNENQREPTRVPYTVKSHTRTCDIRVLDRTHINNDIHYCDVLQEEVDREGMCKVSEETEKNANADDTIESEGGLLEGPMSGATTVNPLPVTPTAPPSSSPVFAVGHGDHQAYQGTDHTNPSNHGHYNHRPQWIGNSNGVRAVSGNAPVCVERRHHREEVHAASTASDAQ